MIKYKISDLNLLSEYLNLYKKCFSGFKKNIEYFRWLYEDNPMGHYIGIDAFDGDKLIGQIGRIPYNFKFYNNDIKNDLSLKTFIGFCDEINESFLFRKIPEILKPSPLNFLYKFLKKDYV